MRKLDLFILFFIAIVALIFRLYKINTPLADLHSWRQADTAAVARNFVRNGFNLLLPRYDDLSNIQSGKDNPQGLRFVEFPIYNASFALLYKAFPALPLEIWGRITTIIFSLIIIFIIYYLVLKESGRLTAIISSLIYAVFPFFVFFSRVVLPDTMAISMTLISIFFLYLYSQNKAPLMNIILYLLSLVTFALSILIKPMVIFYGLTLIYCFIKKYKFKVIKQIHFYLFFLISLLPFILWRIYIKQYPEGIPENTWLIFLTNSFEGKKVIFFRPAFFRWIFFERINNLILGGYVSVFFILGILRKHKSSLLISLLISAFLYIFTFQGGNVQHEYYQILILPVLAMFIGLGVDLLLLKTNKLFINRYVLSIAILIIFLLSVFFSFYQVRNYYGYPQDLIHISKIIKTLTKPEDRIITDTLGDTTLLYLSERRGSPAPYKEFDDFKKDGYSYFLTMKHEVVEHLKEENKYKLIFETDNFSLFKL